MIKINGKDYKEAEIDFNAVCELEDMGIKLQNLKGVSGLKIARAYMALCLGGAEMLEVAGAEINAHVVNGGTFETLTNAFAKSIEESGFFQALRKKQAEETGSNEGEQAQAK